MATFVMGVAATFLTQNGTGAAALLAIGAALIVIAVLGNRIQTVEFGGATLTLRDIATETFALAAEAERTGDDAAAQRLRGVGRELDALANDYKRLRSGMRAGDERTQALEKVVRQAQSIAATPDLEPGDVRRWFDEGTPEARITALAMMEGAARLRDFGAAIDAVEHPSSAFEQYHGLRLAYEMLHAGDLTDVERARLQISVGGMLRNPLVRRDADRKTLGDRILATITEDGPSRR